MARRPPDLMEMTLLLILGVFLLGCSVFFMDTIKTWALAEYGENVVGYLFLGLAGVNFLVEVAINVLLTPAIVRLLDFRNKKKD